MQWVRKSPALSQYAKYSKPHMLIRRNNSIPKATVGNLRSSLRARGYIRPEKSSFTFKLDALVAKCFCFSQNFWRRVNLSLSSYVSSPLNCRLLIPHCHDFSFSCRVSSLLFGNNDWYHHIVNSDLRPYVAWISINPLLSRLRDGVCSPRGDK